MVVTPPQTPNSFEVLWGRRGFTRQPGELQTCTFEVPGASNTTKIPREGPPRERRERKGATMGGRGKKKARNCGPPAEGGPGGGSPEGGPRQDVWGIGVLRWGSGAWGFSGGNEKKNQKKSEHLKNQ